MILDTKKIEHLAMLAKLSLRGDEAAVYAEQLTEVLKHLDSLSEAADCLQKNSLDTSQLAEPTGCLTLADDLVDNWPADEVVASLETVQRLDDGEIIMPAIR